MYHFYYNDTIEFCHNSHLLTQKIEETLSEYNSIIKFFPEVVSGIVTPKPPSEISFAGRFTLADCFTNMANKDLKGLAYSLFTKFPLESYFEQIDEDDLITSGYFIQVGMSQPSALNLVIASRNDGFAFTANIHADLAKNELEILSPEKPKISLCNLYGNKANSTYVQQQIREAEARREGNFASLLAQIGSNRHSDRFRSGFELFSEEAQAAIISGFSDAINRNGKSKFYPDGDLIKDVTPEKSRYTVCELRIRHPMAIRVYFCEHEGVINLALAEKKPAAKSQDNQIKTAAAAIVQLIDLK